MDYAIRLIGIIVIVTAGTTPDIAVNTALAPMATQADYCSTTPVTQTVEPHTGYVRVSTASIDDATGWSGAISCDPAQTVEKCFLFEIPAGSEITVNPHFTASGTSIHAPSLCQLPSLNDKKPSIQLIASPRSKSYFAFEFPPGLLEGIRLANGSAVTYLRVKAPVGSSTTLPIEIQATIGGVVQRTLKVKQGTLINLLYLPKHHATGDLNTMSAKQPKEKRHFFLVNELLSAANQICNTNPPIPRPPKFGPDGSIIDCGPLPDGDPFCSNTGCCP